MKDTEILSAAYIIWSDLFKGFERIQELHEQRQQATQEKDQIRLDKELRLTLSKVSLLSGQIVQMDEIVSKSSKGTLV
jgi:predicted ATPase